MSDLRKYINLIEEATDGNLDLRNEIIRVVGEDELRNITEYFQTGDWFAALTDDESIAFEEAENNADQDLRELVDNSDDIFDTVRQIIKAGHPLAVEKVLSMLDNAGVDDYDSWFSNYGVTR
jgi:hypothetical protein